MTKPDSITDTLGAIRNLYADAREKLSKTNPPCVVDVLLEYPDADPIAINELCLAHGRKECSCGKA